MARGATARTDPQDIVRPSTFALTGTFDPGAQRERLSWQRTFSAATVALGQTLSYDEISTPDAGYVDGSDVAYIILVYGADSPNITLAVKSGNSVVVAEPGISSAYSQQVISVIRAHWPGTRITHIIATQFHFDETGGIRQYAAVGASLIVPGYVQFFREILTRPHTIAPDLLAMETTHPQITQAGPNGVSLDDGAVTVHGFTSTNEARMLLVCTRNGHFAYAGDIFNPGLYPANAPAPEPFRTWAGELYRAIKSSCPEATYVLGSHGQPQPQPLSALIANAA
jgi:glyoxylase-like metal-dependent hydrolase (beta-lactamase superfamily II)